MPMRVVLMASVLNQISCAEGTLSEVESSHLYINTPAYVFYVWSRRMFEPMPEALTNLVAKC